MAQHYLVVVLLQGVRVYKVVCPTLHVQMFRDNVSLNIGLGSFADGMVVTNRTGPPFSLPNHQKQRLLVA